MQIGLMALATMVCAVQSLAHAQPAKARTTTNAEGVEAPTEAFAQELSCIYESAGWDATMNFAEGADAGEDTQTLRDRIAENIAECAKQHNWDPDTQTLAFNTFSYAAMLEYNIELAGSAQIDSAVIGEIWGGLSDEDKAALIAADAGKNTALLARAAAAIRSKTRNLSDESLDYALNALALATGYASLRHQWSQKPVGN